MSSDVLFLLLFLAFIQFSCIFASKSSSIRIPLKQHHVNKDVLAEKQAKRMKLIEVTKGSLNKYDQRLLEAPYRNDYILTEVYLGTPKQGPFNLMISTGQTRLWVLSEDYNNLLDEQKTYWPDGSSTSHNLQKRLHTIDGSYNITADWYSDKMQFDEWEIKRQAFGVAYRVDERNEDAFFPVDGVFGVNHLIQNAYGNGKEPNSPIDNLIEQMNTKTVSIFLDKQRPPSKGLSRGSLVIGDFDNENCNKNRLIFSSYLLQNNYYQDSRYVLRIDNLQYGSYFGRTGGVGFFDNGISTLQFPHDDLIAIYDQLLPDYDWNLGFYIVPCSHISRYNSIYIQLDNSFVEITPFNYIIDMDLAWDRCVLTLEVLNTQNYAAEEYVFGTPFFRERCLQWNMETNQLSAYEKR